MRGLALLPIALTGNVGLAAAAVALTNLAEGPYYPIARSTSQRIVPAEVRGRTAGALSVLGLAGYPLGAAVGGVMIGWLGIAATVVAVVLVHAPTCWLLTRLSYERASVPTQAAA
jgi:MFS family permease